MKVRELLERILRIEMLGSELLRWRFSRENGAHKWHHFYEFVGDGFNSEECSLERLGRVARSEALTLSRFLVAWWQCSDENIDGKGN